MTTDAKQTAHAEILSLHDYVVKWRDRIEHSTGLRVEVALDVKVFEQLDMLS